MNLIYKKYFQYLFLIFAFFILIVFFAGFFKIGLLSDSYEDGFFSVISGFGQKFTDHIYQFRFRPLLFLTLQSIINSANYLGFAYDNFLFYNFINLFLYLTLASISGFTILYLLKDIKKALIGVIMILFFPNNLHNLCWSASFFELLTGIFYISSVFFSIHYIDTKRKLSAYLILIFFILALSTKEIAITLPAAILLINLIVNKQKEFKNILNITLIQVVVLVLYFFFRVFILNSIPFKGLSPLISNPFLIGLDVVLKGFISVIIPLDYLLFKLKLMNFDVVIIIYLLCLLILFIYFLPELIKSKLFSKIILIIVLFFAIIFPFIIAGYIRPQLLIIPFISVLLSLFIILNKLNILSKIPVKILLIIILFFWVYWGIQTVNNWNTAFSQSKKRMNLLVKTEFNKNTKPLIIGNLGRTCQYFMFDNLLYSYNYWKHKRFVLEDTIYQEISTVALNFDSLNSQIKYSKINNNEYEITTSGPHQFFNIGEYLTPEVGDIIRNEKMEIEILKNDFLGKTTKLRFKILSDDYEVFLFNGYELIKL